MALVNKAFSVSVTPGVLPPVIHVSQYDIGREFTVQINGENGVAYTIPTGATASVDGTLNGSVGFTQSATISNNQITFALTESMTAYSGKAWCKIKLTLNSEPIQTCAFILAVDRAGVEAETVIGAPGFEEQIADAAAEWLEDQGFTSPTVTVTPITGGNRVTFTDAEHPNGQSIDVMDGEDGEPGEDGDFILPSGGEAGQALISDGAGGAEWGAAQSDMPDTFVMSINEEEPSYYGTGKYWALNNSNWNYRINVNKNYNLIAPIGSKSSVYISVVSSYLNYRFLNADPTDMTSADALTAATVSSGGTYSSLTRHGYADDLSPELHTFDLPVPEGATWFIVDFGGTQPTDLVFGENTGRYHVYADGVWSESIKDGAVTEPKIAEGAVSESKLQDLAVGQSKIKANAVGVYKLDVKYSNNISTRPDSANVIKVGTGWEFYQHELRTATTYPNGVLWAFHCEAGKYYRIQPTYKYQSSMASLFTPINPDDASYINTYGGFILDRLVTPKPGTLSAQDATAVGGGWLYGLPDGEYMTVCDTDAASYDRCVFRCNKDVWFYWCTARDVSEEEPYIGSFCAICEIEPITEDIVTFPGKGFGESSRYASCLARDYTNIWITSENAVEYDSINGVSRAAIDQNLNNALFRSTRDVADFRTNAIIIGDSLVFASSVGLQNAWRKYITTRLNLGQIYLAVNGTGLIKGAAFDWDGYAPSSENYNADNSGYSGIKSWIDSQKTGLISYGRLKNTSVAIVALGTNDWGNNGTLGSVDTLDDETTFYGAVKKTYTLLHDDCGIPAVVFIAPFKRQNWNQNNSATVPYTIYDLCHALAEIALLLPDMHVVDTLDRWYLNYDDTAIRAKSFVDYVHISSYAHHLFTIDLAKEIRAILAAKGIV